MVRRPAARQPEILLELYEFESCPFCKKVRETLSELDLEYISRTSAKGSAKRSAVLELGGKNLFPFFIDANTGTQLYESEDIIDYLHAHYGHGRNRAWRLLSPLNTASAVIASGARPVGGKARTQRSAQPDKPLVLYGFEASPYCRKVRETMCSLDLDYHVKNVAKNGRLRQELRARGGKMMVPYLIDPNTSTEMYESGGIVVYLLKTYGS